MTRKRTIAVSALADYAADPMNYCARKGQVRSKKHAARGNHAHSKLTSNQRSAVLIWMLSLCVLLYLIWFFRNTW